MADLIDDSIRRFVETEFPARRPRLTDAPRIAAVGTVAPRGLASPLLREQLAAAGVEPAGYAPFSDPAALLADTSWHLALVLSPYKRAVVAQCDALTPAAQASGVVDTLLRTGERVLGVNTNAYAAGTALRHLAGSTPLQAVLILGSGAAARSVALGTRWADRDVSINFAGRSTDHLRQIVADLGFGNTVSDLSSVTPDALVNATTVGETDDTAELGFDVQTIFRPGVRYFDLNNRPSALQCQALAAGCVTASGVTMQILTNALRACLLAQSA
jgi:shikimate dehydrogenase